MEAVTPKYVNSLVELITSNIDSVNSGGDVHPSSAGGGLVEGVSGGDMIIKASALSNRSITVTDKR